MADSLMGASLSRKSVPEGPRVEDEGAVRRHGERCGIHPDPVPAERHLRTRIARGILGPIGRQEGRDYDPPMDATMLIAVTMAAAGWMTQPAKTPDRNSYRPVARHVDLHGCVAAPACNDETVV